MKTDEPIKGWRTTRASIQTKLMRGWSAGGETLGPGQRWQGWCETAVRGKSACVGGRAQGTGRETERWEHRWAQSRNWRGTGGYSYKIQLTKNPDACRQPRSNNKQKRSQISETGTKSNKRKFRKRLALAGAMHHVALTKSSGGR